MIKVGLLHKSFFLFIVYYFNSFNLRSQEIKSYTCINVHTDAYFQNEADNWTVYLTKRVNAQVPLLHCAPAKTFCVEVRFLVQKDGSLADIKPLTNVGYGMEEELIRVIEQAPDWTPATQNGKKCRAYKCADFIFEVKQKDGDFL